MNTTHPSSRSRRFCWQLSPIAIALVFLFVLPFLARNRQIAPLSAQTMACAPDYHSCLHRADLLYDEPVAPPTLSPYQRRLMRVTAICPCAKCCDKSSDGITASGHKICPGDAFAAASSDLPFGTHLIVPGYNDGRPIRVLDRGSIVDSTSLDVFFSDHQAAVDWGVQHLIVVIETHAGTDGH